MSISLLLALAAIAFCVLFLVTLVLCVQQEQRQFDASLTAAKQARLASPTDTPSHRPVTVEVIDVLPLPAELTAR